MFEASLKEKLKNIFDFKKVSFDQISESREQECIFIEVDDARSTIKDGKQFCRVTGRLIVFANSEKLPFGYFQKKIQEAKLEDTKDLFFYEVEGNTGVIQNIDQRSMAFVYFYNDQYNPNLGELTSIEISEAQ